MSGSGGTSDDRREPHGGSGRGGPLGTPGMGNPPDELRPERDTEDPQPVIEDAELAAGPGGAAEPPPDRD